jgi:hypothetical protein
MSDTPLDNVATFEVKGREYTMKFTFNAMFRSEPQLEPKSLIAVLASFATAPSIKNTFVLFKECVRAGTPAMKDKPAREFESLWVDMVDEYGIEAVTEAVVLAIVNSGILGSKKELAGALAK